MWLFATMAKAWRQNAQDALGASRAPSTRRQPSGSADDQARPQADEAARQDDA
jgi:hypothetical protein